MALNALVPPPNPYGSAATTPRGASLVGALGPFSVLGGSEVRVGRDPALCPITLADPRISGVHATLKFEGGELWARDESSNNGTHVAGMRIAPGTWVPAANGASLRFGPIEFTVRHEP